MSIINHGLAIINLDVVLPKLNALIVDNIDPDTGLHCENWVVDMQNEIVFRCADILRSGLIDLQVLEKKLQQEGDEDTC